MTDATAAGARLAPVSLDLSFQNPWSIVLPALTRYEDEQWVGEFLQHGKIRLGTLARFASYPDEQLGDRMEAQGLGVGTQNNRSVGVWTKEGRDAYILCFSLGISNEVRQLTGRNSAFVVENPLEFAAEIARQLPGFQGGLAGHCIYRSQPIISREFGLDPEKYKLPDGSIDSRFASDVAAGLGGPERVLLKRRKYEGQREYRMVWYVDRSVDDAIDIVAPRAAKCCRPVDKLEWE